MDHWYRNSSSGYSWGTQNSRCSTFLVSISRIFPCFHSSVCNALLSENWTRQLSVQVFPQVWLVLLLQFISLRWVYRKSLTIQPLIEKVCHHTPTASSRVQQLCASIDPWNGHEALLQFHLNLPSNHTSVQHSFQSRSLLLVGDPSCSLYPCHWLILQLSTSENSTFRWAMLGTGLLLSKLHPISEW